MTKKSIIIRENKRIKLIKKYYYIKLKLKRIISNIKSSSKERWNAIIKLQSLPRNSSICRHRNRCKLTGRSHGYLRKFGLSRIKFREFAVKGDIPGLKKSSW